MLVEEYYSILENLTTLPFRVPQDGVKFRYGSFSVISYRDMENKPIYSIHQEFSNSYCFSSMSLIPNESGIGFRIKDMTFSYNDVNKFLNEVGKHTPRKIYIQEGVYINLLKEARQSCLVCLDSYDSVSSIHVYSCGHHVHDNCYASTDTLVLCPLCKR